MIPILYEDIFIYMFGYTHEESKVLFQGTEEMLCDSGYSEPVEK